MKYVILCIAAALAASQPAVGQHKTPAPTSAPGAALSPDSDQESLQSPHARLYSVFEAGVDAGTINDGMVEAMKGMFMQDPVMAAMDSLNPGLVDAVAESTRPVLTDYSERIRIAYRPRMIDILASELTETETLEIIDFYSSPIGQRVMGLVSSNYRPDAVLETAITDRATTSADVEKDLNNSTAAAIGEMTPEELNQFVSEMMARPAMMKLQTVMPKITALRAQMEEEPLTPDEDARLQASVTAAMTEIISRPLGE